MVHSGACLSHYLLRPPPTLATSQLYSTAIVANSCRRRKTATFQKVTNTSTLAPQLKFRRSSIQIVSAVTGIPLDSTVQPLLPLKPTKIFSLSTISRDSFPRVILLLLDQSKLGWFLSETVIGTDLEHILTPIHRQVVWGEIERLVVIEILKVRAKWNSKT